MNVSDLGARRYRRAAYAAMGSAIARGTQILATLVSVPLLLGYLGADRYGLWMTVSGTIALLSFADLGLGNGLLTEIARTDGQNDQGEARRLVSNGIGLLFVLSVVLVSIFLVVYPHISWAALFNVESPEATAVAGPAVAVFMGLTLIGLPVGVVQRIQMGYQEGAISTVWQTVGNLVALGALLLAIHLRTDVPWLIAALLGIPILAQFMNGWILFGWHRPYLRPRISDLSVAVALRLLKVGIGFMALQLLAALIFSLDNLIVARVFGSSAVANFSIVARLFAAAGLVIGIALTPLWPAYSESLARGDTGWVMRTMWRSMVVSFGVVGLVSAFLVVFGRFIVQSWVGQGWAPEMGLLVGFAFQGLVAGLAAPLSVMLNGAQLIRVQLMFAVVVAVLVIPGKVVAARWFGLPGLPWCMGLVQLFFWVIPLVWLVFGRRIAAFVQNGVNENG